MVALLLALGACACASAPPAPPKPAEPAFDQKMSWILRLEDARILHDPAPDAPAVPLPGPARGKATAAVMPAVVPPPAPVPDLVDRKSVV